MPSKLVRLFIPSVTALSLFAIQSVCASDTILEQCLGQTLLHEKYTNVSERYLTYDRDALGNPGKGYQAGIDYEAEAGTPVCSPVAGKVHKLGSLDPKTGTGMLSIQENETGRFFLFLHLSSFALKEGDNVSVGTVIGKSGMTGAQVAHLHVEYSKLESPSGHLTDPKSNTNADPVSAIERKIIDTRHATFAGVPFNKDGMDALSALPFGDDAAKRVAITEYELYLSSTEKKIAYIFPMPGSKGVRLTLNMVTGKFGQVLVSSPEVRTSEGVGVGSSFEEWCKCYGEPTARTIPDGRTQYSFEMPNKHLTAAIYEKDRPVTFFIVAHDLKPDGKLFNPNPF